MSRKERKMLCKKCEKKVADCDRHCPHEDPKEKLADFSITLDYDKFTVKEKEAVLIEHAISYDKDLLGFACVAYNQVATLNNVVEINDKVSGLRIVRDRKVDLKTIFRQLNSAKRLKDKNR